MADAPRPTSLQRVHGFDWLRIVCMVAVVAIHTLSSSPALLPLHALLDFAVPCFLMMSLLLFQHRAEPLEIAARVGLLRRRSLRLLYPYAVWSSVFVVLRLLFGDLRLSAGTVFGIAFLGGGGMHLYFIPLLVLATFALCLVPRSRALGVAVCVVCVVASAVLRAGHVPSLPFGNDETRAFPHYLVFELPFLFCAALVGRWYWWWHGAGRERPVSPFAFWLVAALCELAASLVDRAPVDSLLSALAVSSFFCGFLVVRRALPSVLHGVLGVSLGVYYVHPVFVTGVRRAEAALGMESDAAGVAILRCGVVLFLSILACFAIRRVPKLVPVVS